MIPVQPKPEPLDFDRKVRQKGLAWLRRKGLPNAGPVPAGNKLEPYWRACLDELHRAYDGICAYMCIYIHPVTGSATVDHYIAKSNDVSRAYEWNNYRLACGIMNSRKRDFSDVIDPFHMQDETFHLDLATGSIYPNPSLDAQSKQDADNTIQRLDLDDAECRKARTDCFTEYIDGKINGAHLKKTSPFVWKEADRQGLL
ncbi:MAG: hypothetical protein H3C30_05035 [Candidatus Hydrogenedentes bacterium]|nr:hypothetical protein [Candidatus Hydrogenedentota bacterium]